MQENTKMQLKIKITHNKQRQKQVFLNKKGVVNAWNAIDSVRTNLTHLTNENVVKRPCAQYFII